LNQNSLIKTWFGKVFPTLGAKIVLQQIRGRSRHEPTGKAGRIAPRQTALRAASAMRCDSW
jgi:hypothetical protein